MQEMNLRKNDVINEIPDGLEKVGRVTRDSNMSEELQKLQHELQIMTAKFEALKQQHE